MASSNFLKKLRNRISKKKSYDIETPCSARHDTILLRRYDRVPSTYIEGCSDQQNILRDFVPAVQKQQSPGHFRGEATLPRHFWLRSGHHRTQSNIIVVDNEEFDLYNSIGDHRRSSCSCTCSSSNNVLSPVSAPCNGALHLTQQSVHGVTTAAGKGRNAAKDPLPPILKDAQKGEIEKENRLKPEGKFELSQEEVPRYTGIDDYSNVDFDPAFVAMPPEATTLRPAARVANSSQMVHKGCMTLPSSSKLHKHSAKASHVKSTVDQSHKARLTSPAKKAPVASTAAELPQPKADSISSKPGCSKSETGQREVIQIVRGVDSYDNQKISLQSTDIPIPHESCLNKDRKVFQSMPNEQPRPCRSVSPVHSPILLSSTASSRHSRHFSDDMHMSRHYPQNSGHHEYREAHQVLRATSVGKIDSLGDLELTSSLEDLYAHVPKGTTAKTPDIDDVESLTSEGNTDNEDSLPPPPIPSRNYRSAESCCPSAGQLGVGPCTCSHIKDVETGEELQTDGPQSVIHQQPQSDPADRIHQVVEPIHMTLEEVWQDACARGIPMDKPSVMTLQRRHKKSASSGGSSSSNAPNDSPPQNEPKPSEETTDNQEESVDSSTDNSSKVSKKEKFKLKNIFKKGDHDSPVKCSRPGHRRTLSTPASADLEDLHNSSNLLDTSGEMSSSELSTSLGNTSNCTSVESVGDDSAANCQPEMSRTVNADFIESLRKLKDCGWYWGPLSWDGAEARLANKPDGSFLVRDSSDDRYILSISFRSQDITHHTRIEHYKGTFSFFSQPKSHGAGTIIEFIEKAMEHSRSGKFLYFLRPRAPGFPPAPVQLLYPVSRFRVLQSLQHMCRFEILRATRYDHIDELPLPEKVKGYLRESQYYTEYILEYEGGDFMQL